jgi:PhzF family phenazine biosynthesis protein
MNLSETAYLLPRDADWQLRWFTPTVEVDLCGHATLASAHVLWERQLLAMDAPARFHTRSGLLQVTRCDTRMQMDFPAQPPEECPAPEGLVAALGLAPRWVGFNGADYLVELDSEGAVRRLAPDIRALERIVCRGVIVTAAAEAGTGYQFVSRFFAPRAGIDEDPVCGSAHCALAPFWCQRLDRPELVGYQASARGGHVGVALRGERVGISGTAVTVLRGELAG